MHETLSHRNQSTFFNFLSFSPFIGRILFIYHCLTAGLNGNWVEYQVIKVIVYLEYATDKIAFDRWRTLFASTLDISLLKSSVEQTNTTTHRHKQKKNHPHECEAHEEKCFAYELDSELVSNNTSNGMKIEMWIRNVVNMLTLLSSLMAFFMKSSARSLGLYETSVCIHKLKSHSLLSYSLLLSHSLEILFTIMWIEM